MKDLILDTPYKKIQHWISWISFILFGSVFAWAIALGLASYGKHTSLDTEEKKGVLNKTWQKFIYIYGEIITYILIGCIIFSVF